MFLNEAVVSFHRRGRYDPLEDDCGGCGRRERRERRANERYLAAYLQEK